MSPVEPDGPFEVLPGTVVVLVTTVASEADATVLADAVVEGRLAACAKRRPHHATYRWAGAIERSTEVAVEMVTTADRLAALVTAVSAAHPYDLPELAAHSVATSAAYAAWVRAETSSGADGAASD